jgi:hypothetical protein
MTAPSNHDGSGHSHSFPSLLRHNQIIPTPYIRLCQFQTGYLRHADESELHNAVDFTEKFTEYGFAPESLLTREVLAKWVVGPGQRADRTSAP